MGQVFYREWTPGAVPDVTYNIAGALPEVESWTAYSPPRDVPFQPEAFYDNRRSPAAYYLANLQRQGYTLDELYPYPRATDGSWFAPAQPIRADIFNQLAVRARGQNVAGAAPTKGIYTGVSDIGE
jgi:hypothetical protein